MKEKLYKGKYLIGLYHDKEDDDSLIVLCDNVKEFSEAMKIKYTNAQIILSMCFNGKQKYYIHDGEICKIFFIKN